MISRVQFRRSLKKKLARTRITAPCLKVVGAECEGGGWVYKDRQPIQEYSEEQTTMSSVCAALNPLIFFQQTSPCKSPASTGCCLSQFLFDGETGLFLPLVLTCHFNLKWTISSKANGWWTSNHCSDITAQRYVNMGKELYGSEPVFRAAVDQCAKLLEGLLPRPLLEATWGSAIGHRQGGLLWCCAMLHFWSNTMSSKVVLTFPLHMSLLQHRNQNEIRCKTVRYDIVTYLYTYTFWSC